MSDGLLADSALHARKRAIAKTVLYRLLMVTITVTIAWAVVDDLGDAVNIGIATNLLKTGTYYAYERFWDRITWGMAAS